jgi:hypothetical protein
VKCFGARRASVFWSGEGNKDKRYGSALANEVAQSDGLPLLRKACDDTLDGFVLPIK